jgi:hypothetical protein
MRMLALDDDLLQNAWRILGLVTDWPDFRPALAQLAFMVFRQVVNTNLVNLSIVTIQVRQADD